MQIINPLSWFMTTTEKADFAGVRQGGLFMIEPRTTKARIWLEASVDTEAQWYEGKLVIEPAYVAPLVDAIIAAGFLFDRGASQGQSPA